MSAILKRAILEKSKIIHTLNPN
uniref:Uncharacterized protein n=1 Tax=Anguilla anguilla TaxID=7936 RepID=A0A0E9RIX0_ANGAN